MRNTQQKRQNRKVVRNVHYKITRNLSFGRARNRRWNDFKIGLTEIGRDVFS